MERKNRAVHGDLGKRDWEIGKGIGKREEEALLVTWIVERLTVFIVLA